jgi:2-succinyl-5-enolpyruvyl-6-hydroxy-3-cyclohexene-1-carboxylate synthase
LQAGDVLVAAASNPIRDLDLAAEPFADGVTVLANRGLSGIDGTISTAIGVALSRELTRLGAAGPAAPAAPVRLLIGDLAFLHDANALLAEPGIARPSLQIVVLNDGGGGIFSLLEHGARALEGPDQERTFERMFGTPQDVDLAALCAAYGVPHQRITEVADLDRQLAQPGPGTSVVELVTARDGLRDLHAELRMRVHASVRAQLDDLSG